VISVVGLMVCVSFRWRGMTNLMGRAANVLPPRMRFNPGQLVLTAPVVSAGTDRKFEVRGTRP
jgi:hypothetical protein